MSADPRRRRRASIKGTGAGAGAGVGAARLGERAAGRARLGRPGGGGRWLLLGPVLAGARLPAAPGSAIPRRLRRPPSARRRGFQTQFEVDALIGIPLSAGPAPGSPPAPSLPPARPSRPLPPLPASTWCSAPAGPPPPAVGARAAQRRVRAWRPRAPSRPAPAAV